MLEQYAEEIALEGEQKYGFVIPVEAIIAVALLVVESCIEDQEGFLRAVRNPTRLQKAVLRFRLSQELGLKGAKAGSVSEDVLTYAAQKTDDEIIGTYLAMQAALGNHATI